MIIRDLIIKEHRVLTEDQARAQLMEDPVFRQARQFGQLLVEYQLTKDQVQQLFKDLEQGATAAGNNRTGLGKAKDFTGKAIGSVQNMLASARKWVKERPTYQAVDAEYNKAMAALGKAGGENGEANAITQAIYKYRDAAKKYPRATGLAKWAIVTAAGLATGGVGGAGVAAGLAAIDSAIKDKEIVDIVGDAATAALVSGAAQGASELGSMASDAYNGLPSSSDIAANNSALGNWNDTDVPGGAASNINGLDLPAGAAAGDGTAMGDTTPNIVGPGVEGLSPEEISKLAAQAKAYGIDGDVTLDQLNKAIMQTAEPGTVPADYSQIGAGGGTTDYTAVKGDTLSKIAEKNGVSVKELADANGIDYKDVHNIKAGQTLKIPGETGSAVYDQGVGAGGPGSGMSSADANNFRADNLARMQDQADAAYYQDKPDDFGINPRSNDAVGSGMPGSAAGGQIDYTKPGPTSTDSMGGKLEYGIPVNDKGSFIPPNSSLPAEELAKQQSAYDAWKADYTKRWPSATQLPDGSMRAGLPIGITPKYESVKIKVLPNNQLIDSKFTVYAWALNESTNRDMGRSLQLTKLGVRTVFENIGRYRRAYLKEYIGAPTADYGHPTAAGAPASATAGQGKPQGWFGRQLDNIGRGVDKVGKWASNVGHNVITKVTADKLSNMWNRAGEPYDSDRLYQLLTTDWGVPKEVVDSVYQRMNLSAAPAATAPTTAPAATTAAPATAAATTATAPVAKPGAPAAGNPAGWNDPKSANYVGRREVARRQSAQPAASATPNFGQQGGGYAKVNQPTTMKYSGVPMGKPAAPAAAAPVKQPTNNTNAYVDSVNKAEADRLAMGANRYNESLSWSRNFNPGMTLFRQMKREQS